MTKERKRAMSTEKMVISALMTALVVVFQLLATYTAFFGPFSTAMALIPIAIGAILCGPVIGAWLGFVFAVVVMVSGGANLFFAFDICGTIVTVLSKGVLCGFVAGLVYKCLKNWNVNIATVISALVCPVINTGVFMLGCFIFFMDDAVEIAKQIGSAETGAALFIALALGNFIFELGTNIILSPVIVRLINIVKKK